MRILLYVVVFLICLLILYPYFAMFCTSLKDRSEIFSASGTVFPKNALWSNFADIWSRAPMAKYMMNSILIAGGSTIIAPIRPLCEAVACAVPDEIQRRHCFPWICHCFPDVCACGSFDWYLQGYDDTEPDQQHSGPDFYQCSI